MVLVEQRRSVKAEVSATLRHNNAKLKPARREPLRQNAKAQHAPVPVGALGGVQFSRCPCGFTLAKHAGKVFWIRARPGIHEIRNLDELARALATNCWHAWRRKAVADS